MENDCYPRFLKSEIYQDLLEQAEQQWKQDEEEEKKNAADTSLNDWFCTLEDSLETQLNKKGCLSGEGGVKGDTELLVWRLTGSKSQTWSK